MRHEYVIESDVMIPGVEDLNERRIRQPKSALCRATTARKRPGEDKADSSLVNVTVSDVTGEFWAGRDAISDTARQSKPKLEK